MLKYVSPNAYMTSLLLTGALVFVLLPFNSSVGLLYTAFFILGVIFSSIECTCLLMLRNLNVDKAAMYLAFTGTFFGIGFLVIPLAMVMSGGNIFVEYIFVAMEFAVIGLYLHLDKESCDKLCGSVRRIHNLNVMKAPKHFRVEVLSSLILFSLVGGQICAGTYLAAYIDLYAAGTESNRVVYDYHTDFMLFTSFTSFSKFFVPFLQASYPTLKKQMKIMHVSNFLAVIGASLYLLDPQKSNSSFVIFLISNGIFTGGTAGVIYAVNGMLTDVTYSSTMIMMFGVFLGMSFYPYIFSLLVENDVVSLINLFPASIFFSMTVTLLLSSAMTYLAYDRKQPYQSTDQLNLIGGRGGGGSDDDNEIEDGTSVA